MSAPVLFELRGKRVYVSGHAGMVGAAIARRLERERCEIITATRRELDLRYSEAVDRFMAQVKPDAVFVAAGKVGASAPTALSPPISSPTILRLPAIPFMPLIVVACANSSISFPRVSPRGWRRSRCLRKCCC